MIKYLPSLLAAVILGSCNQPFTQSSIEAIAFKADKDDDWGLMTCDGKIIVEDEFDGQPFVNDGIVWVSEYSDKQGSNEYSFYTLSEKPDQIGDDYIDALPFNEGLAPVVEEGDVIKYINQEGKVEFTLDKEILKAGNFFNERAAINTKDGKWGYIDKAGNIIIKAEYEQVGRFSEDYAVVEKTKEGDGEPRFFILNKEGEIVLKIDEDYQLDWDQAVIREGRLPVEEDDEWGFIDVKGEEVVKCKWDEVTSFTGEYACIKDDGEWGIINKDDKKICRAKYGAVTGLSFLLKSTKELFTDLDDDESTVYDYDENEVFEVDGFVWPFLGEYAIVQESDDEFYFIDDEGNTVKRKADGYIDEFEAMGLRFPAAKEHIFYITGNEDQRSRVVESDFFDIEGLISDLRLDMALPPVSALSLVIDKYEISDEDLPRSKWGSSTEVRADIEMNEGSATVKFWFYDDVTTPEKKTITAKNYWGKPITRNDYTGEYITNLDVQLNVFQTEYRVGYGKGDGKEREIAKGFVNSLEKEYGIKLLPKDSNDEENGFFQTWPESLAEPDRESLTHIKVEYDSYSVKVAIWLPSKKAS